MKNSIPLLLLLFVVSCKKERPSTGAMEVLESPISKRLEKVDLPTEVIQAEVEFVSNPVNTNKSIILRYELSVNNNFKIPFTLQKIEVYDFEKSNAPISTLDSTYIDMNFDRPGGVDVDDMKYLKGNDFGVLNMQLSFSEASLVPKKIYHKLYFKRLKGNGEFAVHPMEVAPVEIPTLNTLTIGFPFQDKGLWFYETDSHQGARQITEGRLTYPQRFAVDWMLLNPDGSFAKGNMKKNSDWKTYGVPIIAVADGQVAYTKDNIKENIPFSEEMAVRMTHETLGGNYVVLDIGNSIHASYGHLQPNSIRVKIGDKVKKGQVLGLLGNSGNSDCPHLHFQLETKSNSFFGGEGIPYHFENFITWNHFSEDEISVFYQNNRVPKSDDIEIVKKNEYPIGYGLIKIK
ncbi:hypothetical protein BFP77_03830 [Maribacter sp. 4U21]|uniref:M23 family metallopeptidase n=1 Tax=Maribacter sp. 4U21 TaxID=1889779 RepID=UPI000C64C994|nr:M23 family metallopeptidase [Maribacter sp. 4U21]PIB30699.1 hypothetical protein BFP77_03830 [Maribacter sp. 4U21]